MMKPDSLIKQGLWYCNEKCALSLEEQRRTAKLVNKSGVTSEIEQIIVKDEDNGYQEENSYEGDDIDIDLDIGNNPTMPTLEELEHKYKEINQVGIKTFNYQKMNPMNDILDS